MGDGEAFYIHLYSPKMVGIARYIHNHTRTHTLYKRKENN